MTDQATISEDDLYATIAEAFQALRQDDYVQDLPAGSQRRRDRITRILVTRGRSAGGTASPGSWTPSLPPTT